MIIVNPIAILILQRIKYNIVFSNFVYMSIDTSLLVELYLFKRQILADIDSNVQ